ncbi:MAG: hypothetical protein KUG68_08045 [Flavobacteriaceae bacterium]|nr:hypothetical protein [Flavobacteriaceae bacterium]
MKNLTLKVSTILSVLVLFSCSKDTVNETENQGADFTKGKGEITANDLQFVGVEHNQMLAETYNYIESVGQDVTLERIQNNLVDNIKDNDQYNDESNAIGIDFTNDLLKTPTESISLTGFGTSERENVYLNELQEILNDAEFGNQEFIEKVMQLENAIANDGSFSDEQLITLYSATQVAQYSFNYWSHNLENWENLARRHGGTPTRSHGGDIVGGDVAGAVAGAAGAWAVNVVPGAGQVAYGGAILGGAVAGSVGVAVTKIWDWFWD